MLFSVRDPDLQASFFKARRKVHPAQLKLDFSRVEGHTRKVGGKPVRVKGHQRRTKKREDRPVEATAEDAHARIGAARTFGEAGGGPLTRAEYEAAAKKFGVETQPDSALDTYAIRYGDFTYPHYTEDVVVARTLEQRRLLAITRKKQEEQEERERRMFEQPLPQERARWGQRGTRYDDYCGACGREADVDNATDLCRRCYQEQQG
jgi:hypothetical protein